MSDIPSFDTRVPNDVHDFVSCYVELRNLYLHSLRANQSLRDTVTRLTSEHRSLQRKYHLLCEKHDERVDEHTSDL